MKGSNVIVINGRRYDAHTGEPLDAGPAPRPKPAHDQIATVQRHEPAKHHKSDHGRRHTHHAAPHAPEHSRTLMRQVVKKPEDSLKHRIKVQGRLDGSGERPSSRILTRSGARRPNTGRLQNPGTKRAKGQLISHFSPELFYVDKHTPAVTYGATPVRRTTDPRANPAPTKKSWTTDELLEYAVQNATAPQTAAAIRPRRKPFLRRAHGGR